MKVALVERDVPGTDEVRVEAGENVPGGQTVTLQLGSPGPGSQRMLFD